MEKKVKRFLNAQDVAGCMDISISKAYKIIRSLNDELERSGFLTVSGKVSRQFFEEKVHARMAD